MKKLGKFFHSTASLVAGLALFFVATAMLATLYLFIGIIGLICGVHLFVAKLLMTVLMFGESIWSIIIAAGQSGREMTMTTAIDYVTISLSGTGKVTIDWGDCSKLETRMLLRRPREFSHSYPYSCKRTIKIAGRKVTKLTCLGLELTDLDVSKNTALKELDCSASIADNHYVEPRYNYLKNLDVSKNIALIKLDCSNNPLSSLDVSKNTALKDLNGKNNFKNLF